MFVVLKQKLITDMVVRIYTFLSIAMIASTVYILFYIKNSVTAVNYQLAQATNQIEQEKGKIHLLKAELAYLGSPNRLRKLVSNHLMLQDAKTSQVIRDPAAQDSNNNIELSRINDVKSIKDQTRILKQVNWRYKKMPHKYLRTVSH